MIGSKLSDESLGEDSDVGCHAVVTKNVEPYMVVAGNPARKVKSLKG